MNYAKLRIPSLTVAWLLAFCPVAKGATPASPSTTPVPWQSSVLSAALGHVNPASNVNGWHPLNLGIETSNASVPLFAFGPSHTEYLANSAGVWQHKRGQWTLISPIPGSTSNAPYAVAITVSRTGVLYIATTGLNPCIWKWTAHGWVNISTSQTRNVRFLTWTPDGHLIAGTNEYPAQHSNGSELGPAPIPSLGLYEYLNGHWQRKSQWLKGQDSRFVQAIALAPNGGRFIATDKGIYTKSFFGWKLLSGMAANDLAVWHQWLVAATFRGLSAYDGKRWITLPNTPAMLRTASITNLYSNGTTLLVEAQDNFTHTISAWLNSGGSWTRVPYQGVGVHYVGMSPAGVPTMELQGYGPQFQIWQRDHTDWHVLRLPYTATRVTQNPVDLDIQQYNPQNIAWSPSGRLTVSTEQNGVWQRNRQAWTQVGGPIDNTHPYSTGTIGFTKTGTLLASVKEEIPLPPRTPRMLHTMTWVYRNHHWSHVRYPSHITENLIEGVVVAPNGDLLLLVDRAGIQLWTYHSNRWTLTAPTKGFPKIAGNTEVAFAPGSKLTVSVTGFGSPSQNGLYQVVDGTWRQVLSNPSWLQRKNTYWARPAWLPDGSIVFCVMNDDGYHLWRYSHGTWQNLDLPNQPIDQMFVLPGGWLYAVSDAYVCWVKKLT